MRTAGVSEVRDPGMFPHDSRTMTDLKASREISMKTTITIVCVAMVLSIAATLDAQKWGEVDPEDLVMTEIPGDPDANAVVLFDIGEMTVTRDFNLRPSSRFSCSRAGCAPVRTAERPPGSSSFPIRREPRSGSTGRTGGPCRSGSMNLYAGHHHVLLRLEGYADWYQRMYLPPGEDCFIVARLVEGARMNHLEILSSPPGADILLDGEYRGVTPLTAYFLPAGGHTILGRYGGEEVFRRFEIGAMERKKVELAFGLPDSLVTPRMPGGSPGGTEGGKPAPVPRCLQARPAGSTPPAALAVSGDGTDLELLIDGENRGELPLNLSLDPGYHDLCVTRDGVPLFFQHMCVLSGKSYDIEVPAAAGDPAVPVPNRLSISSDPADADVFIDDRFRGTSPLSVFLLEPGEHSVALLGDSLAWHGSVAIGERETRLIHAGLSPAVTTVSVLSPIDSVRVLVDGDSGPWLPARSTFRPDGVSSSSSGAGQRRPAGRCRCFRAAGWR